jgi:PKD repeat protein
MADFSYSSRVGNIPMIVDFQDLSVGTYTYRKWIFGDGVSIDGNETSVSHTYTSPGVYSVTLVVGNSTEQDQVVKENIIYVNESIEDTKLVIAESKDRTGVYWKLYIDELGKMVFETHDNKKITEDKIVLVNRWMFLEYHVESDSFYVGSYANGRRLKPHNVIEQDSSLVSTPTGFFKIAPNSSYIIDDLKIWEEDQNLFEYFNGLRGRAGFLDPLV